MNVPLPTLNAEPFATIIDAGSHTRLSAFIENLGAMLDKQQAVLDERQAEIDGWRAVCNDIGAMLSGRFPIKVPAPVPEPQPATAAAAQLPVAREDTRETEDRADGQRPISHPVANVGEEASGTEAVASGDPASREADDADRQQLADSGFTGDAAVVSIEGFPDTTEEPGTETPAAPISDAPDAPAIAALDARSSDVAPLPLDEVAPRVEADQGEDEPTRASSAPVPSSPDTLKTRIIALHAEHPEFTILDASQNLDVSEGSLRGYSSILNLKWAARKSGPAPGKRDANSFAGKVRAVLAERPDANVSDVAEILGVPATKVNATCSACNIPIRKMTKAEIAERIRIGVAKRAAAEPVQPAPPADAPEHQPTEDRPPEPAAEPAPTLPTGTRFFLRNDFGEYLHQHERGMTRISSFYWTGTEADIRALKKRKPNLRDLYEKVAG